MAFNGSQNTAFARSTPNDGLLLQVEFARLYGNANALKDQADMADGAMTALKSDLGVGFKGSYIDLVARLAALDNYLRVGKIEWFADHFDPSENAPWLILSNPDAVLDAAHWPDLVPFYRAKLLKYMPGTVSAKTAFDITSYTRSSNTVTITLANTDPEKAIIAALAEENLVHGSFSGWISIYLPSALNSGDVPAGDYAITALDAGARTISFAHTGSNIGATAVTATISVYPHRIPGSTTTARHYQIAGRTLVSINDAAGEVVAGLRRRDRFQRHVMSAPPGSSFVISTSATAINPGGSTYIWNYSSKTGGPVTDGINGDPRVGATTDPRTLGAIPALWAGRYVS